MRFIWVGEVGKNENGVKMGADHLKIKEKPRILFLFLRGISDFKIIERKNSKKRKNKDNIVFYPIKISNNNINLIKDQIFARIGFYFLLLLSRMMIFYFFIWLFGIGGVKNEKGRDWDGKKWKKLKKMKKVTFS